MAEDSSELPSLLPQKSAFIEGPQTHRYSGDTKEDKKGGHMKRLESVAERSVARWVQTRHQLAQSVTLREQWGVAAMALIWGQRLKSWVTWD